MPEGALSDELMVHHEHSHHQILIIEVEFEYLRVLVEYRTADFIFTAYVLVDDELLRHKQESLLGRDVFCARQTYQVSILTKTCRVVNIWMSCSMFL